MLSLRSGKAEDRSEAQTDATAGPKLHLTKIKVRVIGIGGCGCSSVRRLMRDQEPIDNFSILATNTDGQNLDESFQRDADGVSRWWEAGQLQVLQLGEKGLGGGGDATRGEEETMKAAEAIKAFVADADVVNIVCGLGKATGGGGAPVVARFAQETCPNTLVIATKPFLYEGKKKLQKAREAREKLRNFPAIFVNNEAFNGILSDDENPTWDETLDRINKVVVVPMILNLRDIAQVHGNIFNSDVADFGTILKQGKDGWFNTATFSDELKGEALLEEARQKLLQNPFLDRRVIRHAKAISIWFRGGWKYRDSTMIGNLFNGDDVETEPEKFLGQVVTEEPRKVSVLAMADLTTVPEEEDEQAQQAPKGEKATMSTSLKTKSLRGRMVGRDGKSLGNMELWFPTLFVERWKKEESADMPDLDRLRDLQQQLAATDREGRYPALPAPKK